MRRHHLYLQLCSTTLTIMIGMTAHAVTLPKNVPIPTARPDYKVTTTSAKTNVCSITINSSEEIETFKASLPAATTNFIELTSLPDDDLKKGEDDDAAPVEEPTNANEATWLKKACKQKIKCDVLVISGHFGGSFFGSSGLSLSMENLEQASCDQSCDGILQNPKEVFLFGCNTLAGKKQDHRSPEEYRRVLRADGFSAEQAEQVVAFRYSPIGDAFSDRMRRVFRGAPRIYGFDSVGPSGKNVKGLMNNYFKSLKGTDYYLPENLRKLDEALNGQLAKALKVTALTQESGAKEMLREQIPVCYLNNPKIHFNSKLQWIVKSLRSEKSFSYLPSINDFLTRLTVDNYQWKDKEFEILEPLMGDTKLRDSLAGIVARRDSAILGMQLKVLTFMKFFGWVYNKDYMKKVESLLIGDLNQAFDTERKDQICSYAQSNQIKVDFSVENVPAARFKDVEFVKSLPCVAGFNEDLMERTLREYMATPLKSPLNEAYKSFLHQWKIPDIAGPRYFSVLFPKGDQGLDEHQRQILCNQGYYSTKHPLMAVTSLNPVLSNEPKYVQESGCYLKFTQPVMAQVLGHSKDPALKAAVISALSSQKDMSNDLTIDDDSQHALMDLKEGAGADDQYKLATIWGAVKNMLPAVQTRMKASLYKTAMGPVTPLGRTFENLAMTALKPEVYCPFALERAEMAIKAGFWDTTMDVLESFVGKCNRQVEGSSDYAIPAPELSRLTALIPQILQSIMKVPLDQLMPKLDDSQIQPYELFAQIIASDLKLVSLDQAQAMTLLNERTYQGRMGYVSSDSEIMKKYDTTRLAKDVIAGLASSNKDKADFAYRTLRAIDINDDSVLPRLMADARKQGFKPVTTEIDKMSLLALGTQDEATGTKVWMEIFAKSVASEREYPAGFGALYHSETSTLIAAIKAGLKAKTLSDDLAGEMMKTYARTARANFEFNKLRDVMRGMANEFPRPKIQEAARAGLRTAQERETECDEMPRACSGREDY